MKWQSKNRSKSVGHIFNQFNAFWVLLCILINILSLFLFITSRKIFRGDQFGHYIYINELKMGESFSTEKMVSFHQIFKKGLNIKIDIWKYPIKVELVKKSSHRAGTLQRPFQINSNLCAMFRICTFFSDPHNFCFTYSLHNVAKVII